MKEFIENFLRKQIFSTLSLHVIFIAVVGFLVYSNTFYAPFELDDKRNIIDNPAIKSFQYFKNPSVLQNVDTYKEVKKFFWSRYIGYLTFALNYRLHGLDVFGYHVFNVLIHITNAFLVYWIVIFIFRTPYFRDFQDHNSNNLIAFFSALIFVVHPIQTQAVTYIVQRFTSLATFFYLFSLFLYIKSRRSGYVRMRCGLYAGSIIFAVLSMKTKEIAFTLPIIAVLYEFMFLQGNIRKRILYLIPMLLTILIIPMTFIGANNFTELEWKAIEKSVNTANSLNISSVDYFITQIRIIVTYIRLLLLPINQNLDYNYPIYSSFFALPIFLSLLLLLSIVGVGIYLFYHSRSNGYLRLTSFGIFWFFITLTVESSIIPLANVIFEHRMYLPSIGFIISTVSFLMAIKIKVKKIFISLEEAIVFALIMIVLIFCGVAYARNTVWQTEIGLWEDVVRKSYGKARPHYNLGLAYSRAGKFNEAIKEFLYVRDSADFDLLRYNLGWVYFKKNMLEDAEREYLAAIKLNPNYTDAYINLGAVYMNQGRFDDAIEVLKKAIAIKPDDPEAHYNLGGVYEGQGKLENAIEEYKIVLRQRPKLTEEHNNIGVELFRQGRFKEAERKYRIAIGLKPDMDQPHYNLALALKKMKKFDEAVKELNETIRLKPDMERAYYNLGLIYKEKGLSGKAKESFQAALKLKSDYQDAIRELEALK